ncbi:MAG: sensor domain-containing diguanylate cyclase [Acidobacteria bacterium]|nr:sensor domain-containing diguanylate cyclase [Acidobacteriota bacterium]
MVRGARRIDFASRLKARLRALRARLERPDAVIQAVRDANATLDPQKVAAWLVGQADQWIPAPCWAVVAHDVNGHLAVLADRGLTPARGPSLWAAANWVMRHGAEFTSADLSVDQRAAQHAAGTVVAFPLICRQRAVGVLLALDPEPSAAVPSFGAAVASTLRMLLEPAAIALDNAVALQKAEALSVTDDLTRLYNPRYLNLVLRREAKRASRSGRPLSLLFIDLDGFKRVNDTHGHLAGSKSLVEAAAIIRGSARETDVVARFGGDEFAVILPDTGREGAVAVAERVRDRVRVFRFLAEDGLALRLTASIGVATLPDAAGSAEELLKAADQAMYTVKDAGKNGIHVAEEER